MAISPMMPTRVNVGSFLDEICHFPNAAHDDQVDAVSLAVQMMETQKKKAYGL